MTLSYSAASLFNQCATCEFWGAARIMRNGYFRKTVEVEGEIDGKCMNPESLFVRHEQPATSGCSKWVKWREIGV